MKKEKLRKFGLPFVLLFVFGGIIFHSWFGNTPLSSGDWSFHFPEEISNFILSPSSWMFWYQGGLGGNWVFLTGLETYFLTTARIFYQLTGLPWTISERILWYLPFLLIGTYASVFLMRTIVPRFVLWWLTPVIFLTNTYILMITGGGQMGIAMAYALAPLVLAQFIRFLREPTFRRSIITGFVLSIMILFDPRIAYVVLLGVFVYWSVAMVFERTARIRYVHFLVIPFVLAVLAHAFWILPLVVFRISPMESMGSAYNSVASVKFFSFSDFSHALALLHPNWPENLFGKVYFLQPEFLLIPVLAFFAFMKRKTSPSIISMGFIAILGVFLAKGANDPGGWMYLWLFTHVPGFNVFRDPTKFYLLIAIAYSILIPVALDRIGKKWVYVVFVLFWLITIRQAVTGGLGGTFVAHTVPSEYEVLKDVINQPEYFRTLWVPHVQRYGFLTYMHPAIDAGTVLDTSTPSAMLAWINSKEGEQQLARWSVKYIVLPYDSQGELFLDDRKYSEKQRNVYETALDANPNIIKKIIPDMSPKLSVYETSGFNDHFWLEQGIGMGTLSWRMKSPTNYTLSVSGLDRPATLIFSESYDPYWQLDIGGRIIRSEKTQDSLNSFSLPVLATASGTLEYLPQHYVWIGLAVSAVTMIGAAVALAVLQ